LEAGQLARHSRDPKSGASISFRIVKGDPDLSTDNPQLTRKLCISDLALFLTAALINLNSVPVVASVGRGAILLRILGFLLFLLPEAVAVLELLVSPFRRCSSIV